MSRALLAVVTAWLFLQPGVARPLAAGSPLAFFKNYFLTGDYLVGGSSVWRQGINGRAAAEIEISGAPAGADIVAAFLYVQTAEAVQWSGIDHATFNGVSLGPGDGSFARALNWDAGTYPCWAEWDPRRRIVTYRADVLRFLPIGADGKTSANGIHTIEVPDDGSAYPDIDEAPESWGGMGPRAVGAALVVVYRNSSSPFKAIVIHDGGYSTLATQTMDLTIDGFYQASSDPQAKMTPIVGNGLPFRSQQVSLNGQLVAVGPFSGSAGPRWDVPTFANLPVQPGASSADLRVETPWVNDINCLALSAVVFSTGVQDSDGDGLLDVWEASDQPVLDPNGQALPNLKAMGADPFVKDLFIEIAYMYIDDDPVHGSPSYGGVPKPAHSHLPSHEVLRRVGDAFANAPTGRINVHFDVGEGYPFGEADPYIIRGAGLARGGAAIDERVTVCTGAPGDPPDVCQFSAYPGTVGWKTGFQFLRDEVLAGPPIDVSGEDPCEVAGAGCVRRFDRNRKDIFRFALFAHAIGLPQSESPLDPGFHVPRTATGVGDFPGGDLMVTLGAFADVDGLPVGTPFMQASTLMHELGHGLERRHGGEALELNCKPTYLSVMNYLYQLRGLVDDGGVPHLDFSRDAFPGMTVDETALVDGSVAMMPYRIGWYAPLATSYLASIAGPVSKHCNGSPLLPTDVPMIRVDARTSAAPIDWKADGVLDVTPFEQDVNFNGRITNLDASPEQHRGSDDWSNIVMNQVGSRRTAGGLFIDAQGRPAVGPLSLDTGRGDLGRGDLGRGDLGRGDLGRGDLGRGDLGRGDLGRGDLGTLFGRGDLGRGDLGGGDLFQGNPAEPWGEIDFVTAVDLAKAPPNQFSACVIGETCAGVVVPRHRVRLEWTSPNIGGVAQYEVLRIPGADLTPAAVATAVSVGQLNAVPGQSVYTLIDGTLLPDGQAFTYFTRARYADGILSDPSNVVTIVAVSDPPIAVDDSYATDQGTALVVPAPGVLGNDQDPDGGGPLSAVLVSGPSHGTLLLDPDGSFVYTPAAGFHGTDAFTYRAVDGARQSAPATVSIAVNPVVTDYVFVGVKNVPPGRATIKAGSTIPMQWRFSDGSTVVDSAHVDHVVTVRGPLPDGPVRTFTNPAAGNSGFRYSKGSRTWRFNLQTSDPNGKHFAEGTYEVTIVPTTPGFASSPVFEIRLRR